MTREEMQDRLGDDEGQDAPLADVEERLWQAKHSAAERVREIYDDLMKIDGDLTARSLDAHYDAALAALELAARLLDRR